MNKQWILENISKEIRTKRHSLGLSQEELADRASLDRSYLSEIETGKKNLSVLTLVTLAEALGLKASDILHNALGHK